MQMKLYYTCFGTVQKYKTIGLMYKTGSVPVSHTVTIVIFTRALIILGSEKNTITDRFMDLLILMGKYQIFTAKVRGMFHI